MRSYLAAGTTAVLLAAASISALSAQSTSGAEGHWEGAIQVPAQALDIVVDLASRSGGTWEGTITIPQQNLKAMPLSDITVSDDVVAFAMKGVPGDPRFKGKLSKDPRSLSGDFTQGGATIPFTLSWKGEPKIETPARSTAVSADLEGPWEGTLNAGGTSLRLIVKLANEGGMATGSMISVDQGGVELPITTIRQEGARLVLLVPTVGGSYEGEVKEGRIEGTWTQGPGSLPLVLTRRVQ
jgi:hypothetical protein